MVVIVLSSFIHFSSYSVLVQAFIIIFVYIQFSFLIKQIYEMASYSTQLKITGCAVAQHCCKGD